MRGVIFMVIWTSVVIFTGWFMYWWTDNAPYCCFHPCGQTYNISTCWGNIVSLVLVIICILIPIVYLMLYIGDEEVD